jgi:hypothetical protein
MGEASGKPASPQKQTYVLAARDYADVAHLENPGVVERVLSGTRSEATAYICNLLQSGVPRYVLAGPKGAITAMAIETLSNLGREVSAWKKAGKIPEDFSGRAPGYQTWVELLVEIDSNPTDAERLKAMKAMFLAANKVDATDGESIVAYQLFQVAKKLTSGELLLLKAVYEAGKAARWPQSSATARASDWRMTMAARLGHQLSALVQQNERALIENGLLAPSHGSGDLELIREHNARMSDLGMRFCENLQHYEAEPEPLTSDKGAGK